MTTDNGLSKTSTKETKIAKPRKPKKSIMEKTGPLACQPIDGQHLRFVAVNDPRQPRNMHWAEGQRYTTVSPEEQDIDLDSTYSKDIGSDIRVTGNDGITLVLMKQDEADYQESIEEMKAFNNAQVERKTPLEETTAIGTFGKTVSIKKY